MSGTTTGDVHTAAETFTPPLPDHPIADLTTERIKRRSVLGGLLNEYERVA
jgi:hypothetical protein